MVDPQDVKEAFTDHTILISIIYASNEVGTVNPLSDIGEISQNHGVLFHSDAVQGIGKIESNVDTLKVDLMSLTAHKMYGPKGIGALYIRSKRPKIRITPQNHGGGQEAKIRSGTLTDPSIVGFGKACEIAQSEMATEAKLLAHLRNQLRQRISENIDFTHVHGHPEKRLPEHWAPGNIAEPLHGGLQPQQPQAACPGDSPEHAGRGVEVDDFYAGVALLAGHRLTARCAV